MAEPDKEAAVAAVNASRLVLEQIANKWSVLILTTLCAQPSRFNVIKRRLDPITHKALTEALRRLERNGLVNRKVIASSPVAVEYSVTPLARSLQTPFLALVAWANQHEKSIDEAQALYDQRA